MSKFSIHLFGVNVLGVVTWAENMSSILGALGAMLGVISGVMLVCANWEGFLTSKPMQSLKGLFTKK